ncbi:LAMI_0H10132g1_1 [Lachancea mirantina]|uniref:RNA helicase n=1 Tax=Lachancea mirantina TaxID=1230905 RepID=A0A1G4KGP7_9SACH|nr:LAMI_0H10132g1_1 [Lachancea mirantina]
MVQDLREWIQAQTSSNVTPNFLQTIKNLGRIHAADREKFIKACKALGKFNGHEEFLERLHGELNTVSEQQEDHGLQINEPEETFLAPKRVVLDKKVTSQRILKQIELGLQDEAEDENVARLRDMESGYKKLSKPSLFKRLSKNKAKHLKEYANTSGIEPSKTRILQEVGKPGIPTDDNQDTNIRQAAEYLSIPAFSTRAVSSVDSNNAEDTYESGNDLPSDESAVEEDREWYDHEDDYSNAIDDSVVSTLNFRRRGSSNRRNQESNFNDLKSELHLTPISPAQRAKLVPPFLTSFRNSDGESVFLHFLDASSKFTSNVDPFRNPDSEFSLNAKRGSRLVNENRHMEARKSKAAEIADNSETAIAAVVGQPNGVEQVASGRIGDSANSAPREPPPSFEQIQESRRGLPAYQVKSELLQIVRDNQVIVIIGETGSGKTTQVPQFLFENGFCKDGKMIGCTQPRRVAAMSVATRVAQEMNVELGEKVGYSIRFEDRTSRGTRVKFMTDGLLLRETLVDPLLDKYSCIIMDEAHERTLSTDILFGIFKDLLSRRRDLKLIITSATMDANRFSNFFGAAPQFTIPGRTFPVEVVYSRSPVSDYVESAITQASKIHLATPITSGDVLIFMTGKEDIEATCSGLRSRLSEVQLRRTKENMNDHAESIEILPIYSALPADIQGKIFHKTLGKRKVVVATNIAETSLTVDGIRYVIDCGYSKLKVYSPQIGLDSLRMAPISLASANQRSGRAGRTGPGIAYRLYTEDTAYDDMYTQAIPEIQRTNLSNTLLLLKSLGVRDPLKFPFIDPPNEVTALFSLFELWAMGALDNLGNLTQLGTEMANFPLQPALSKMLLIASQNKCSEEVLTIVSMLSVPQVFHRPKAREEESDQARSRFFVPESDHLTLLNVYSQWKANQYSAKWCKRHFLQFKSLQRARDIRMQLCRSMERQGLYVESSGTDWSIVRKCICSAYAQQAAKIAGLSKYVHLKNGLELRLHPTSALHGAGDLPPYIVYHELLLTTKEYVNIVTAVDPLWLMEYEPLFYNFTRRSENDGDLDISDHKGDELDLCLKSWAIKRANLLQNMTLDSQVLDAKPISQLQQSKRAQSSKKTVNVGFKRRRPL